MNQTLQFDGSTDCRGRNGWFQLETVWIWTAPDSQHQRTETHVYVYSKVHGEMPPILFNFTNPEELRQLICGLAKALHCMTNPEEGNTHANL